MKIKNSSFVISAVRKEQFVDDDLPEIVFCGRSNVGKSSLINYLLSRKNLARTSSTPGKTQTINFYDIDNIFRFVDLPGYGYAKVSKKEKERWPFFIDSYLKDRDNILEIFLLLDTRRTPSEEDIKMFNYIKHLGFNGVIISTKADKQNQSEHNRAKNKLANIFNTDVKNIYTSSTLKMKGKYKIWDKINQIFSDNNIEIFMERQKL